MSDRLCSIAGCEKVTIARGYCNAHYRRFKKYGDPEHGSAMRAGSTEATFKRDTARADGGCILWTGTTTHNGYGVFSVGGRHTRVHRYAWELANGPIPEGQIIDHTCHNRNCVNVEHMRVATYKHNMENRKGANKNSSTGVRGVSQYKGTGRWRATVKHERKQYHLGIFDTIEEAETAVIAKRLELYTHNDLDRA